MNVNNYRLFPSYNIMLIDLLIINFYIYMVIWYYYMVSHIFNPLLTIKRYFFKKIKVSESRGVVQMSRK